MHVCMCAMCIQCPQWPEEGTGPLELTLVFQAVTRVLGIKTGSSVRAGSALNLPAVSTRVKVRFQLQLMLIFQCLWGGVPCLILLIHFHSKTPSQPTLRLTWPGPSVLQNHSLL